MFAVIVGAGKVGLHRINPCLIPVEPDHEKLEVRRQAGIEAHEVAPLAARAGHLPEHLGLVLAGYRAVHEVGKVGCRLGAFDLHQPVKFHDSVRACGPAFDGWMDHKPNLIHQGSLQDLVGCTGVGFLFGSPGHGGVNEDVILRGFREDFRHNLGFVVAPRSGFPRLDLGHHVTDLRCRDLAGAGGLPFGASLLKIKDLHRAPPSFCWPFRTIWRAVLA